MHKEVAMKFAVVDIQGFHLNHDFVPKELAISMDGVHIYHFNFSSFLPFFSLSVADKKKIRYLENKHHGIYYSTGGLTHFAFNSILRDVLWKHKITTIYVKGDLKKKYLEKIVGGVLLNIINVEYENECPKLYKAAPLCTSGCHQLTHCICASNNCIVLYDWLKEFY